MNSEQIAEQTTKIIEQLADALAAGHSEQLTAYLDSVKNKVKGKIVLVGKAEVVPVVIEPTPRRLEDKAAAERFDPPGNT